jgi:hypothetical protein
VISQPFDTVHIDIVGKIIRASAENHSYILTIMDAATHFVVAVPLRKIDSVTVAESFLSKCDLLGYPRNVICDNGSNLTADIVKEIYRTFGIVMKNIPVYWPRANLVERQHAVIKNILRKLIVD